MLYHIVLYAHNQVSCSTVEKYFALLGRSSSAGIGRCVRSFKCRSFELLVHDWQLFHFFEVLNFSYACSTKDLCYLVAGTACLHMCQIVCVDA